MTSTIQSGTTCCGLELWLISLYFTQRRPKATQILPALKLDLT